MSSEPTDNANREEKTLEECRELERREDERRNTEGADWAPYDNRSGEERRSKVRRTDKNN